MPYYPLSRIITGSIAQQNQFVMQDGKEYIGPYYITYDGKYFSGINPQVKGSFPLFKLPNKDDLQNFKKVNNELNQIYDKINNNIDITTFQEPKPYIPKISISDYNKGKITRYFAKERKIRVYKIIEIDKETYEDIFNRGGIYNYPGWDVTSMFWTITNGNLTKDFVEQQNKRIIELKNKQFIGIKNYLTDLTKFSKL